MKGTIKVDAAKGAIDFTPAEIAEILAVVVGICAYAALPGAVALAAAGYRAINGHALSFDRLERLSERTHRLSVQGALKWDAALAASLEVPQELVRPLMSELGFVADGKRTEESYKRRRPVRPAPVPPPDPDSPFSVLARLRETPR